MPAVRYAREGDIGTITLHRPAANNTFDDATLGELDQALVAAEQDTDARVILVRATGSDFSLGADVSGAPAGDVFADPRNELSFQERLEAERKRARRWEFLFNLQRPTVAQVQGRCYGPGLYLALSCDIVVASEDARFGDPSVRMGLMPAFPLLVFLVGPKKAKEYVLTGRAVEAREAEQVGLINRVVPRSNLEAESMRYVRALAIPPTDGMVFAKESLNAQMEARGLGEAWRFTSDLGLLVSPAAVTGGFDFFGVLSSSGEQAATAQRDALLADLGL